MTFKPIDAYTLADDFPFGFQLRYAVDNARACIDDRQPAGSHAYVGTDPKQIPTFSTPSDRWRNIPVIWFPEAGAATLTARVRASVTGADGLFRLRLGDRVGAAVTVSSGTNQTIQASLDVTGLGLSATTPSESPVIVALEFQSGRAATELGTVELVGTLSGLQLAINDADSILGSPSAQTAGHYEIEFSESDATPSAHVQTIIPADHHSDFEFDFWIDRDIGADPAFRPFSGEAPQTAGPDEPLYSLTTFTVDGWEIESEGDGANYFGQLRRQFGSGQGALFRSVNTLTSEAQDAVARTMRWLVSAPSQPGAFGIGARVGDVDDTAIGGAIVQYREDSTGFEVAIAFIAAPQDGEGQDVTRRFYLSVTNLTAGGTTVFTADRTQDRRVGRATGYAYGVGATASSAALEDWSSLDLGLPADARALQVQTFAAGFVSLPTDGDRLLVKVYSEDGNVAVPCLCVREKFT